MFCPRMNTVHIVNQIRDLPNMYRLSLRLEHTSDHVLVCKNNEKMSLREKQVQRSQPFQDAKKRDRRRHQGTHKANTSCVPTATDKSYEKMYSQVAQCDVRSSWPHKSVVAYNPQNSFYESWKGDYVLEYRWKSCVSMSPLGNGFVEYFLCKMISAMKLSCTVQILLIYYEGTHRMMYSAHYESGTSAGLLATCPAVVVTNQPQIQQLNSVTTLTSIHKDFDLGFAFDNAFGQILSLSICRLDLIKIYHTV